MVPGPWVEVGRGSATNLGTSSQAQVGAGGHGDPAVGAQDCPQGSDFQWRQPHEVIEGEVCGFPSSGSLGTSWWHHRDGSSLVAPMGTAVGTATTWVPKER